MNKNTKKRIKYTIAKWLSFVPDKLMICFRYWLETGKKLNLNKPATFTEKLNWLKLYNRNPLYIKLVDKYAVKKYVADIIGEEYVIPTLGVWEKPEDIDWDNLPNQFVMKCTHDSGGLVICRDKVKLDKDAAIKKLQQSLNYDYYIAGREWPYKSVPRRIIAEKFIEPEPNVNDLPDYKWYCFNGEPKYCQVIQDRSSDEKIDFFDAEWNHQEFIGLNPKARHADKLPTRPENLNTHIKIARKLSKDIPYARVDLYDVGERIYFGEITLYPGCGFGALNPEEWNYKLGDLITLPPKQIKR